ncbi:hypothetical protein BGZ99_001552 [Dissophora globulifera]|uniref:Uncharacterized protein n=1 Tax=Dissophora globulifera TaxID=979702 RepID=A0A9P6RXY0_9FUNG|nr:hypothetical protein BGZ99_001552 [Dissophora globulifera]
MRFHIVFIALSMMIWAVAALPAGVADDSVDLAGATEPAPMEAAVEPSAALPAVEPATPEIAPVEIVPEVVATVAAPAGPKTAAEETADSALACMDGCAGNAACQNNCVATVYKVDLSSVPPAVPATVSATAAAATPTAVVTVPATVSPTATPTTPPRGSNPNSASVMAASKFHMAGALVAAVAIAGMLV